MAESRKTKQTTLGQFHVRQMPNPSFDPANAVSANNPRTIRVYNPWKPNEMMALSQIPDRRKSPASFVDHPRTTMCVYHADSRDLWAVIQQIITPSEHTRLLTILGQLSHEALANIIADNNARVEAVLTALANTLQKPINLARILDVRPKKGEGADEFLERFSELYMDQSGDKLSNRSKFPTILWHLIELPSH